MMNWCSAPKSAPYCPRTASVSLYTPKVVHEIFWVLVNSDVTTLCLLCLFITGNNGPSFYLQSLCTEEKHLLQFDNAPEGLYRHSYTVRSVLV
jgi:hypothetical protein